MQLDTLQKHWQLVRTLNGWNWPPKLKKNPELAKYSCHILVTFPVSKFNSETSFLINFLRRIKLHTFKAMQSHPSVTFQGESKFQTFTTIQGHLRAHITTLYACFYGYHKHQTPSNQHAKAFLVSKFNSGTSFLINFSIVNQNFIV